MEFCKVLCNIQYFHDNILLEVVMKILEVRDSFIKLEADCSIGLSSFIKISSNGKDYVAQVIRLKPSVRCNVAYAKILFLYDGELQNYDSTLPSNDAEVTSFTSDILNNSIILKEPVIVGKMHLSQQNIQIDASAFNKKILVSIDNLNNNNVIVRNVVRQFENLNKKVVIVDTLGVINAKKYIAGKDFKLPLNTETLAFLYRDCLNDATAESKATIVEIFKDLAEYSKSVPFLPFKILKSIVDNMVDCAHVFKLLVLKNKLAKFDKLGYFANNYQELNSLNDIFKEKCVILDLSKLEPSFLNQYITYIYSAIKENAQVLLEASNLLSKQSLKSVLSSNDKATIFITHSKFKYLNDIKNIFDNFIIEPSLSNNKIFNIYQSMLIDMPPKTYLVVGEATNYIPLVSSVEDISELPPSVNNSQELEAELNNENLVQDIDNQSAEIVLEPQIENELSDEQLGTELISQEPNNETYDEDDKPDLEEKEHKLQQDEIIANIDEKSEQIIAQASENLVVPTDMNMFGGDELEEEAEFVSEEVSELTEEDLEIETDNLNSSTIFEEEESSLPEQFPTEMHASEIVNDDIEISEEECNSLNEEIEEVSDVDNANEDEQAEIQQLSLDEDSEIGNENLLNLNDTNNDDDLLLQETDDSVLDGANEEVELDIGDSINLDLELDGDISDLTEEKEEVETNDETNSGAIDDSSEIAIMPLSDNNEEIIDDFTELNPDEATEDDIIVDMSDEDIITEEKEEQIVQDVDKVFTTRKDEDFSESDLDFIDELNGGDVVELNEISDDDTLLEELENQNDDVLEEADNESLLDTPQDEKEILETKNASTPLVPVYDADIPQEDRVISDFIEQGDSVVHAKYGSGVVEKMIKYGNKTLYSINFENIGRRLLDPTLTEIKKA